MPSPFPGMDPYLEGYLWPDVHNGLAFLIKEQLAPRLMDAYTVVTDTYMLTDTSPGEDIGIMYNPDPDTYIDLGLAFRTLYERSYYQKSIDYLQDPPPPAFSDEDRAWMRDLLAAQPG